MELERVLSFEPGTVPAGSGYGEDDAWIWCGSVIRGEDGRYHMFASRWENSVGFDHWATNSTIVRAVSDTPFGPYVFRETIAPCGPAGSWDEKAAHNPTIRRHGGRYHLFYTGTTYAGARPGADDPAPWGSPRSREAWHGKRIGLLTADTLEGPWRRAPEPLLDVRPGRWDSVISSNAAPWIEEDGRAILVYKSTDAGFRDDGNFDLRLALGVAGADCPGGPYRRLREDPILSETYPGIDLEDPYLWRQGNRYYLLAKDFPGSIAGEPRAMALLSSEDGIRWEAAGTGLSRTLRFEEGGERSFHLLERPQLLFEDGRCVAVCLAAAEDQPFRLRRTRNYVVPLRVTCCGE